MEYVIAWSVYVSAGLGSLLVLMRVSRLWPRGLRNLIIGLFLVLVFTPWFVGSTFEYYAPAVVVLFMDLFLEGSKNGLRGGVPLLFGTFLMLLVLIVLEVIHRRRQKYLNSQS